MKVCIIFKSVSSPAGGGNQFLGSLKKYLNSIAALADLPPEADVIIFNSHHNIREIARLKFRYPHKIFIHRVDGPMRIYNRPSDCRDAIVNLANKYIADATVFQSKWSQNSNHKLGMPGKSLETVIYNAADPDIFSSTGKIAFSGNRKIRLVAANWSPNPKKGFAVYKWLDENLNFEKYQMTFIGNSPVRFKNIEHLPAMNSPELAEQFRQSDIFIFASPIEACSNLLIEALSCGLVSVVAGSASNPEIVGAGGELFDKPSEIPLLLEKIVNNYAAYLPAIKPPSIKDVAAAYLTFAQKAYDESPRRKFTKINYSSMMAELLFWKCAGKVCDVLKIPDNK